MPVIEISALPQADGIEPAAALHDVTRAVASVLGEDERGTWATWRTIEAGRYAEGPDAPEVQPHDTHPPIVRVVALEGRAAEVIERVLVAVADALAAALELEPGNVFVRYDEATPGRLYTGGSVVG